MPKTEPAAIGATGRFMRRKAVCDETGLPTSSLYSKIAKGEFPRPIPLGKRAVAWDEADVLRWKAQRLAERDHAA